MTVSIKEKSNALIPYQPSTLGLSGGQPIYLPADNLHTYMIGLSGYGKSNLLRAMAGGTIAKGLGVCVIDPHGHTQDNLIDQIIMDIPPNRLADVILLDINTTNLVWTMGLFSSPNPNDPDSVQTATSQLLNIFERVYDVNQREHHNITMYLPALLHLFLHNPELTVLDIPAMLSLTAAGKELRQRLVNRLPVRPDYEYTRSVWEEYNQPNVRYTRSETVLAVFNKFRQLSSTKLWPIFSPNKNSVSIEDVLRTKKILLVKLNASWRDVTSLIGSVLISQINAAAHQLKGAIDPFSLYVDEFQLCATKDFAEMFQQVRKLNLRITIAHQNLTGIDEEILHTAFGAQTKIVFQGSSLDTKTIATIFDCSPRPGIPRKEALRAPIKEPIQFMALKGAQPGEKTRAFVEQYARFLLDSVEREEQQERRMQGILDKKIYGDRSVGQNTIPGAWPEFHVGWESRYSLNCLNALFYRACMCTYTNTHPDSIIIDQLVIDYFIQATHQAGNMYLYHRQIYTSAHPTVTDYRARQKELYARYAELPNYQYETLLPLQKTHRYALKRYTRFQKQHPDCWHSYPLSKKRNKLYTILMEAQRSLTGETNRLAQEIPAEKQKIEEELELLQKLFDTQTEYDRSVQTITTMLREIMRELAIAPVEDVTGQMQEIPTEIPTHEVADRIANELKQLKKFHARVRTGEQEYTIETLPPKPTTIDIEERITLILHHNIAQGYLRLRSEVEADMMQRNHPIVSPQVVRQGLQQSTIPTSRRRK